MIPMSEQFPRLGLWSRGPSRQPRSGRAGVALAPPHFSTSMPQRMKITIEISPELDATIDNMGERLGETNGTTILRGMAVLESALDPEEGDERLVLVNDAESSERELEF
jgi:hypothetical protein